MVEAIRELAPPRSSLTRLLDDGEPPRMEDEDTALELDRVGDLVTRGAYTEAGQAAEALLGGGLHDVRLVGPYLLGLFLSRGPAGMPDLFASILDLLTEHWEDVGPSARKEVMADNGLRWLFKAMSKQLEYHERRQDAVWKGWCVPASREPLAEALERSARLLALLGTTLPKGGSVAPFRQLVSSLQTFQRALPAEPEPVKQVPPPVPAPKVETAPPRVEPAPAQPAPEPPHANPIPAPPPSMSGPMIPASPALELLMRKLQAFDKLVHREDFLRAGVVAADVLALVESFDPRVYLPALFAPFFARLSKHAGELEPQLHDTQSLSFRALQQLYQVDLEAFLAQGADGKALDD